MFPSIIRRHAEMVFDLRRTIPLLRAIRKTVRPGDVVVDIGCGLGILSFAACHAGAKRVYAIDIDGESLEFARWQARKLGMEQKICFLEDYSYHIDLAEKVDLLIQETVGRLAFDENLLPAIRDGKKRFLKPGGRIVPKEVALFGKLDGQTKLLAKIATKKIAHDNLRIKASWEMRTSGRMGGILLWPKVIWTKGLETDCSPYHPRTHWRQTTLGIHPLAVKSGELIDFELRFHPHSQNPLAATQMEWKLTKRSK